MSPIAPYSGFERLLLSLTTAALVFLGLALGMQEVWHQYYPGQEDISLILESARFNADFWLHTGYFEWFNVHPGEQPVVDYEIRPLTHLMTWALYQVAGEQWWMYLAFNAFIAAAFAGVMAYFILTHNRHWFLSCLALVLVLVVNPSNSLEFLLDHSFYQVLLCSLIFVLMYQSWRAGRFGWAATLCILGVVLKESAWFYPGVLLLLFLNQYLWRRQWSGWVQGLSVITAILGSAVLFVLMHPSTLLSSSVAVFSIGMYEEGLLNTMINGVSLLPHFWQGPYALLITLICAGAVVFAYWRSASTREPICLLLPALLAGWLFHEELRWTHELTLAWVAILLTLRGRLLVVLLLITAAGWCSTSLPRLEREWRETRTYGFYAHAYRKPFMTAQALSEQAGALGINTLLVANDPLRMNGDYYSVLSHSRVNWVTLNSIDYPLDARYPNEMPLWKGNLLLLKNAGEMGFMGFKGHADGWLDGKGYGQDTRVLKALSEPFDQDYPQGRIRFLHKGHASIIQHMGPLPAGVAYAYFWRDSKDAWLFHTTRTGKPLVRLVSPYAKPQGLGYRIDVPLRRCNDYTVSWSASVSEGLKLQDCRLQGHLEPGQYVSIQVKQEGRLLWAYVLRTPDQRVILKDTQEIVHEQQ